MTVVPFAADSPLVGDCRTTVFFGWFDSTSTRPTWKPAAWSVELALSALWPLDALLLNGYERRQSAQEDAIAAGGERVIHLSAAPGRC